MIVTFCGHSKIYPSGDYAKWLDIILPSLIEGGAATFYLGGYGAFDSLAAAAVRRQKAVYPHIMSILVLAYLNRETDVSLYDGTTYPPLENVPPRYAIVRRNEWMVRERRGDLRRYTWVGRGGENSGLRAAQTENHFPVSGPGKKRVNGRGRTLAKNDLRRYAGIKSNSRGVRCNDLRKNFGSIQGLSDRR